MDTAATADRPKPNRRWLPYRLPALLIVAAAGIVVIWLAVKIKQAHAQRAAVAAILKAGGQVAYEDQDEMSNPAHKPRGPEWLRSLLGDDALVSVTRVDLSQAEIHDADLAQLENLPRLQSLCLNLNDVGDAGLKHLEGLTRLRELFLCAPASPTSAWNTSRD